MRKFINPGCGECVEIERDSSGVCLVMLLDNKTTPYVVCYMPNRAAVEWSWGEYFVKLKDAQKRFKNRIWEG